MGSRATEGPEAVQDATEACLRLLARRARTRSELTLALERKGYPGAVQEAVLEKLTRLGYLDDVRFGRERAAALLAGGKLGPRAVQQRLEAHGLSAAQAQEALRHAGAEAGFDPLATARAVLERRGLLGRTLTPKERARAARLLAARGFPGELIEGLLGDGALETPGGDE